MGKRSCCRSPWRPENLMRKYAGAGCVVLGIMLSGLGVDSGESINSRLSRLFTGWMVDAPMLIVDELRIEPFPFNVKVPLLTVKLKLSGPT